MSSEALCVVAVGVNLWSERSEALNGYFFFTEISESVSEETSCIPER